MPALLETAPPNIVSEPISQPIGDHFEVVDGELMEKEMGFRTSRIGARICSLLDQHVSRHQLGWVSGSDAGYQCFAEVFPDDPDRVRMPDAAFVSFERLPLEDEPEGYCPIAPDLAVEVVSIHDTVYEVEQKIHEYLQAGTKVVWVVVPISKVVRVYRPNAEPRELRASDELRCEDIIPGFRCQVADIFQAHR